VALSTDRKKSAALPHPFLKWAGGKGQLVERLSALIPKKFNAYFEPFLGGGALFFSFCRSGLLQGKKVYLSDINAELVDIYQTVRKNVGDVIGELKKHPYDREHYHEVRSLNPKRLSGVQRAARMMYLNRTCYNGLYRVNQRGEFNVPFGRYQNPRICDPENLHAVAKALRRVELKKSSFEAVICRAKKGDFVYFDPPYVPLSKTANFVSYAKDGFDFPKDQEKLAEVFEGLSAKGVWVMLSNSNHPWVRERYRKFKQVEVQVRRNVNARADRRGPVGELVVINY
jgi:DNA adenine methylase